MFLSALAGLALLGAVFLRYYAPYQRRHRVVVHTKDDKSIEGILYRVYPGGIVLRAARLLTVENREGIPLKNEIIVERSNVSFIEAFSEAPS